MNHSAANAGANHTRVIIALARADFVERVRRYTFFVTLLFAVFLGYSAATGKIVLRLGDYRGVYTSGWIGTMVALVTTTFVSLIGFYIVKNAIDRDCQTGVGQILATTPLSKPAYTIGKALSNFVLLATIVFVLAIAAIVMQIFFREDPRIDVWALLSPFLLIALPMMALTASVAVLFETLPVLGGGVGNVIWFFMWAFGISIPALSGVRWLDPAGFWIAANSMMSAARAVIPGYKDGFSLSFGDRSAILVNSLRWEGIPWTLSSILMRLAWIAVAIAIAMLAAVFFDRFDPARAKSRVASRKRRNAIASAAGSTAVPAPLIPAGFTSVARSPQRLSLDPLATPRPRAGFIALFEAELRLAVKGFRWWWYVVALGLLVAEFLAPIGAARGPILATAWLWPVLIWSAMGTREERYGTSPVVFSAAHTLTRQFPACFLAGVAVAAICGLGVAVRLLIASNVSGMLAWAAGVLFIPSLALCLGTLTGTSKAYEGIITALWYVGPMNHVAGFDYTGAASGTLTNSYAALYLVMAALLLVAAFARRATQLRHV